MLSMAPENIITAASVAGSHSLPCLVNALCEGIFSDFHTDESLADLDISVHLDSVPSSQAPPLSPFTATQASPVFAHTLTSTQCIAGATRSTAFASTPEHNTGIRVVRKDNNNNNSCGKPRAVSSPDDLWTCIDVENEENAAPLAGPSSATKSHRRRTPRDCPPSASRRTPSKMMDMMTSPSGVLGETTRTNVNSVSKRSAAKPAKGDEKLGTPIRLGDAILSPVPAQERSTVVASTTTGLARAPIVCDSCRSGGCRVDVSYFVAVSATVPTASTTTFLLLPPTLMYLLLLLHLLQHFLVTVCSESHAFFCCARSRLGFMFCVNRCAKCASRTCAMTAAPRKL